MRDTIMPLLESERMNDININEDYYNVSEITENQKRLLGYTTEKVIVMKESGGPYLVEFGGNLERYIVENNVSFEEAMRSIEEMYNIDKRSINVVLKESDIGKLDIEDLMFKDYKFLRFPD